MKKITNIVFIALVTTLFACEKEKETDDITPSPVDELYNLKMVQSHEEDGFVLEFYTESGKLEQGYNNIVVVVKTLEGQLIENPEVTWSTEMTMMSKKHSSPFSSLALKQGSKSLLEGNIVFQMASNESEYWEIEWTVKRDHHDHVFRTKVEVATQTTKRLHVSMGTDSIKYLLALANPSFSAVGSNTIKAVMYKMQNMYSFPIVNGYTIEIDPRMPAMGNHSSPNNVSLTQKSEGGGYEGTVNFTMTGYWKINLILKNDKGEVVKGEPVTEVNQSSSIYFDTEF